MKVLNANDPDFVQRLMKEMGVEPGDTLTITTPQFTRTDGVTPIANPGDVVHNPHKLDEKTLRALGLSPWDDKLWLIPHEWFAYIPLGFKLLCISGEEEVFDPKTTDDDMRFGMLAYGIVPDFAK